MCMFKKMLKSYDYPLLAVYIIVCLFGLIMVYSSSVFVAINKGWDPATFYNSQLKNWIISLVLLIFFAVFPYKIFQNNKMLMLIMFGSAGMLLLVLVFGDSANNAQSWLAFGPIRIQPSEFIKVSMIVYMAAIYSKKQRYIDDFNRGVLPPVLFLVVVCFLILLQPDIGTAAIIFMTGCGIIMASGMRLKTILKLVGLGLLILAVLCIVVFLLPEDIRSKLITTKRIGRITSFQNPFTDHGASGYQLVNSFYAIGSGGFFGQGLGGSVQKLGYLPEAHTDFISAIIAEELGFFGILITVGGIFFIVLRSITNGMRSNDTFGSLLCYGTATLIGIQAFINLGGATGMIPLTGVTLPFTSFGGSSLMSMSILVGIVLNVSMMNKFQKNYGADKDLAKPKPKQQVQRRT
nr:FtsW/RodA/SpoVE family cell cycle protein [Listeria grandensis]